MRKILTAAMALTLIFLLCGCGEKENLDHNGVTVTQSLEGKTALVGDTPCAFPMTDEPQTIRILAAGYGDVDQNDVFVWQKYAEMTGVTADFTTVKRDKRAETVASVLINGQPYDLIMRCKISSDQLTRYGESGLILDLAELLPRYAPNCWAYLTSHPDALASVTNPDGAIYSLPQVNSGAELRVARKIFINRHWLEKVGMELPTTTEEFYTLLRAFRDGDANGNGDKSDEIPLCCADWSSIEECMFGAFGLGNRGIHNLLVDCDEQTGGVRFIESSTGYREYLSYMHRLYNEGLLDNSIFTVTDAQWRGNIANDLVGAFASTNLAWLPADKAENWVAIDAALEGPDGDRLWSAIRANFHSTGAAVLPATCRDPALILRWLDYFWTDEGTLFYHMGVEGETFTVGDDGTYDYAPQVYERMAAENKSFDDVVATISPYPGGSNPTVEIAPYFMGGEMGAVPAAAARKLLPYGPTEYWPSFTFTAEESERLGVLRADIDKYCDAMRVEFVSGARPLTGWDDYTKQLSKLGTRELLSIYEAAVNRYKALKK